MKKVAFIILGMIAIITLLFISFLSRHMLEDILDPEFQVKFAANYEFVVHEDGLNALKEYYGIQFDEVYEMAIGLTHEALRAGDVDVAKGFATDGKIKELDLVNLKDDKELFPAYHPAPIIRKEILQK